MPHETELIVTIAAGLGLAFVFGFAATRVKLPPLVGYLLAGVLVGPFTPGYVADQGLANQLAEEMAALIVPLMANYDAVLAPATASGKNVLPRVAAMLDVMQLSDVT